MLPVTGAIVATKKPEMYKTKADMKKHEKAEPMAKRKAEKKAGVKDAVMPPWMKPKPKKK